MRTFRITLRAKANRTLACTVTMQAEREQVAVKQAVEQQAAQQGHWDWIVGPIVGGPA